MATTSIQWLAAILFGLAIVHTFSTKFFEHLAHRQPAHAGLWHLLGEVEVVFGFWALVLVVAIFAMEGKESAVAYQAAEILPTAARPISPFLVSLPVF